MIVVRWDQPNGVCHFIQTLPLVLEAKQVPSYLDAATRLNHGFLFPGLGMNPDNHGTYYRLSIPVAPRGYLYDYEVMTYTKFVLDKAVEFLPTLKMAVAGEIEGKDVVAKHKEQLRKAFAEQSGRLELVGKYTSEALDEKWTLTLSGNGRVELLRGSSSAVISSFSIADDTITFVDRSGVLASKEKGVYQFKLDGDELTFTLKEDDAVGRKKVLTTNPWKRITPAQPDAKSGQPKKPAAKQPSKDDEAEKDEPKSSDENPKSAEASK